MPPARKARRARTCSTRTRAFIWRTIPSSPCSSSYARRPERLARLALLRRAHSAGGILRPARRTFARNRGTIVRSVVAHAGIPAWTGIEHPIDLGPGCRSACRASWLRRWTSNRRGHGRSPRPAHFVERSRRAGRRDVEYLARQSVARCGAARDRFRCGMGALHERTRAASRRHTAHLFAGVSSVRSSTDRRSSADLRRALGRSARGGVSV